MLLVCAQGTAHYSPPAALQQHTCMALKAAGRSQRRQWGEVLGHSTKRCLPPQVLHPSTSCKRTVGAVCGLCILGERSELVWAAKTHVCRQGEKAGGWGRWIAPASCNDEARARGTFSVREAPPLLASAVRPSKTPVQPTSLPQTHRSTRTLLALTSRRSAAAPATGRTADRPATAGSRCRPGWRRSAPPARHPAAGCRRWWTLAGA